MKFAAIARVDAGMTKGREGLAGILTSDSPGLVRAFGRFGVTIYQTG